MGNRRRLKDNMQRGMHKRLRTGKKPMSEEQKADQKKAREEMRERTKKDLAKKSAKK